MFSVNRFDPNQHQQQPSQEDNDKQTFNPLSRLNQRLQAKNLSVSTVEASTEIEASTEKPVEPKTTQTTTINNIHVDRLYNDEKYEPSLDLTQPLTKKQKARLQLGFTGANTIPLPSSEPPKPKSSAKLKYLKRKKDRKKSRKRTSTTSAETKKTIKQEPSQSTPADHQTPQPENHPSSSSNPPPVTTTDHDPSTTSLQEPSSEKPKRAKRPKNLDVALEKISKKKKRNREITSVEQEEGNASEAATAEDPEVQQTALVEEISQPGALPRFPAPTNPSLPDPQLLARLAMGLGDPDPSEIAESEHDNSMIQFDSASTLPLSQLESRASSPGQFIQSLSLSSQSISRLKQLEFENLLAVQIAVFSLLMPPLSAYSNTPASSLYPTRRPPRDLCVSAPTGSGKTLSYIVPIVETLSSRVVCRLRALIVLPTRDLVLQVKNTFDCFSKGTGLKAAIITGQHSFTKEQAQLGCSRDGLEGSVDVLIATPGRLVDHLNHTSGFSLQHLCFLVLDEADQLLNKSQAWLHQVLSTSAASEVPKPMEHTEPIKSSFNHPKSLLGFRSSEPFEPSHLLDGPLSTVEMHNQDHGLTENLPIETYNPCRLRPFRILLFSATLRRDPVKLAHLGLRHPVFVKISSSSTTLVVDGDLDQTRRESGTIDFVDQLNGYCLPKTLKQYLIVTRTDLKPLVFFKLLQSQRIEKALCFCKSIDGARRLTGLCRLMAEQFQALKSPNSDDPESNPKQKDQDQKDQKDDVDLVKLCKVECFSSDLSPVERKKLLNKFQSGEINMLICSDIIARGIDITGVQNVINYDSPIDIKKYVHRVGRTARANEHGRAFSLVESQEAKFVKAFLKTGFGSLAPEQQLARIRIDWLDLQALLPSYNIALKKLGDLFGRSIDL
ncbi:uncharacterized protein PGTG_01103 [Puccinia graminis f. sp. tritici CRL 75-36-700-3]|uniref:ATP-dependent RNA helicase n=1 Tax=Puccinia graminis f. sp. tritici (strain CRL 75-36-700-3 / race SCCL) TaxID=418459 RepID=E3JUP7_PUCGT|nr:uncharacterized protein PGTG_01103 [Puccinia graminis f. sp. tritici CRL 75-36-700-3]EFP75772.2 hypothetical protein PGTG_01103 [Puccinia graminis f. sp. tritici CRL 75-36-700-3]